eukprot:1975371-Pyramimonas_sp.AAC.1
MASWNVHCLFSSLHSNRPLNALKIAKLKHLITQHHTVLVQETRGTQYDLSLVSKEVAGLRAFGTFSLARRLAVASYSCPLRWQKGSCTFDIALSALGERTVSPCLALKACSGS